MDFQALMAQAAANKAHAKDKIVDHRVRATTREAGVASSQGKMSAEERQAAIQASLAKHDGPSKMPTAKKHATPANSSGRSSNSSAKQPSSHDQSTGKPNNHRQPPSKGNAAEEPLFRTVSSRTARPNGAQSPGHLRVKSEKVIADLKAAKEQAAVGKRRDPKPKDSKTAPSSAAPSAGKHKKHSEGSDRVKSSKSTLSDVSSPARLSPAAVAAAAAAASSRPDPVKPKRAQQCRGKPVDFSSLLNTAQSNTATAGARMKKAQPGKRAPSDDDEPAGRALIHGPKRIIPKTELHIRGVKPAAAAAAVTPSRPSQSLASSSGKAAMTSRIAPASSALPPQAKKPSNGLSIGRPAHGSQGTIVRSSAATAAGLFTSPKPPPVSGKEAKHQTRVNTYFDPAKARPASGQHSSKPALQSRVDSYFGSDQGKAVPSKHSAQHAGSGTSSSHPAKAASSAAAKRSSSASTSSSSSVQPPRSTGLSLKAQSSSSKASEAGLPKKKKKESKRRGPIWMQEEDWSDEDEPEAEDVDVSKYIKRLFGYDKNKFADEDPRDLPMESSWSAIQKEERMSARIGRQEDLEQERLEEEERKRAETRRKRRRIADDDSDDDD